MAAHLTTRTDQPYVYEDLNLERPAFRLVRLFSGDGPELKCELLQAFIDERESIIPYEAVSYTWGHINLSRSIDIDGKSLGITASLHVALQHFRYTDRDRSIWVDGICIGAIDSPAPEAPGWKHCSNNLRFSGLWAVPGHFYAEFAWKRSLARAGFDFFATLMSLVYGFNLLARVSD